MCTADRNGRVPILLIDCIMTVLRAQAVADAVLKFCKCCRVRAHIKCHTGWCALAHFPATPLLDDDSI